jgi:hypothetical protein
MKMTHEKLQSEIVVAQTTRHQDGAAKRDYENLLHSIDAARCAGGMDSAYPTRQLSADEFDELDAIQCVEAS